MLIFIIPIVLFGLSELISFKSMSSTYNKKEPFECGFSSLSVTRVMFSMRFFLLVVLFLIMDIEISLLLPYLSLLIGGSSLNNLIMWMFLLLLILGVIYEVLEGNFKWT